jgi:hypothetical protein
MNDCGAVPEIAYEIRKRQFSGLGCYQIVFGCGRPESMGRENSPDWIPQQCHAIPAAAESYLSDNAEMASYKLVMLKLRRRHEMNFGVIQIRADLRGIQVVAAHGQKRVSAGLRNVIENVAFWEQSKDRLTRAGFRARRDRIITVSTPV